jgi:hypothetical protein
MNPYKRVSSQLAKQKQAEKDSPRHWMMYVKWERVKIWKERVDRELSEKRASQKKVLRTPRRKYPYSYGSRQKKFLELKGDVLWLITLPAYRGYRQAPSLIARLDVQSAREYDYTQDHEKVDPEVRGSGNYIVFGKKDSKSYLPINNVFHVLLGLKFHGEGPDLKEAYERRDRSREERRGPYYSLANHFRTLRQLTADSGKNLERFAKAVNAGHRVFLSYKRSDFNSAGGGARPEDQAWWPRRLGESLSSHGISCWWDYWHIPQDIESKRFEQDLLENILEDAVRQSAWFVALMTHGYCQKPESEEAVWWTRKEWDDAKVERTRDKRKQQMRRIAVLFDNEPTGSDDRLEWLDKTDVPLWVGTNPNPEDVCQEILKVIRTTIW